MINQLTTENASAQAPNQDQVRTQKTTRILEACRIGDLPNLTLLATSEDGLINDETRRVAWPLLLGCSTVSKAESAWTHLPPHPEEGQVKLDVDRSFVYYPKNESSEQLDFRKVELQELITEVLRTHPKLCYFQGYHDIVQVLLLVLGRENASEAVARLSLLRIRDFMLPTLSAAIVHLRLLPPLLRSEDPKLESHLSQTQPFFALAATLTLYAHDIQEYGDIARLYDFLLAHEAAIPVYFFATIVMSRKKELLDIEPDEPEMLHSILSKLPKPLNLEKLISDTMDLFHRHPPQSLPFRAWRRVSEESVLKTTHDPDRLSRQTIQDGERLFAKQVSQLHRAELMMKIQARLWKYRRPARGAGIALLVGLLSLWIARGNNTSTLQTYWNYLRSWI